MKADEGLETPPRGPCNNRLQLCPGSKLLETLGPPCRVL
jgi:hypothetical protein